MGRAVGDVGWPLGIELPAEGGNDFAAEQFELLEDGLGGQAGVVDQEQLALVVTEVWGDIDAEARRHGADPASPAFLAIVSAGHKEEAPVARPAAAGAGRWGAD